eukprot:4559393-Prymnesium_polylepis.1
MHIPARNTRKHYRPRTERLERPWPPYALHPVMSACRLSPVGTDVCMSTQQAHRLLTWHGS